MLELQNIDDSQIYLNWIDEIKQRIYHSQQKAMISVNTELLDLYWYIGNQIVTKQKKYGWGSKVLESMSHDLQKEFPESHGYSRSNLHNMRAFALAFSNEEIIQAPLGQLTWYHIITLQTKIKDKDLLLKYAAMAVSNGWSRNTMVHHIELKTAEREGQSSNNFSRVLPDIQSDLANEVIKDPYKFGFLTISDKAREREIENELVNKIKDFLLELGKGFAFLGSQFHLEVNGDDFYIDLMFYHTYLHCYFVVELKTGDFKPEYIGQLCFYVTAVDEQVKTEIDNPTIGLLLCKNRNKVVAEYSLKHINQPIGISDYQLSSLPNSKDIENVLLGN